MFDRALSDLTSWWYTAFEIVPGKELSRRDVVEVEHEVESWKEEGERLRAKAHKRLDKEKDLAKRDVKGKGKAREPPLDPERIPLYPWQESPYLLTTSQRTAALDKSASTSKLPLHPVSGQLIRPYEPASSSWEVLRPPPTEHKQSLNLAASTLRGSKDLSAQLYVALLRAIDIPARLVVSLQALEWRSRAQTTAPPARSRKTKVAATASTRRGGKAPGDNNKKKKAAAPVVRETHFDTTTDDDDDADFVAVDEEADRQKGRNTTAKSTAAPQTKAKATSAAKSGTSSAASDGSRPPRPTNGKGKGKSSARKRPNPDVLVLSSSASAATSASDTDGSFEDGRGKLKYKVPKVNLRGPSSGAKVAAWKRDQQLRRGTSPGQSKSAQGPAAAEAFRRLISPLFLGRRIRTFDRARSVGRGLHSLQQGVDRRRSGPETDAVRKVDGAAAGGSTRGRSW